MNTDEQIATELGDSQTATRRPRIASAWELAKFPLTVFAVTRLGLYFVVSLSFILLPTNPAADRIANPLINGWANWDGAWYRGISQGGYQCDVMNAYDQRNLVFFPLFPLAMRAVTPLAHDSALAGLIVSNVAFLLALILLFQITRARLGEAVARRTIVLLAVFPFALFFSAVYTESVALLTVVAAFFFGERRQWLLAGICAALASASRLVGVLVVPALALLYLSQIGFDWRKIRPNILWLGLGVLGLGGYIAYLTALCGDTLLFVRSELVSGWMAGVDPGMALRVIQNAPAIARVVGAEQRDLTVLLMHLLFAGAALVLAVLAWRLLPSAYALLATLMVLGSMSNWTGMGRYMVIIFPLFMVAAILLKNTRWYLAVAYVSALLMGLFAVIYTHAYWIG